MKLTNSPFGKNTTITNDKHKELDSKILKPMGMNRLKHVLENGSLITHQTLAKVCKIIPLNAGIISSGLNKKY